MLATRKARSPEARAARKKAQLARLAAKGNPEYPELYASQPVQIKRKEEADVLRKARRDAKRLIEAQAILEAEGAITVFEAAQGEAE